MLEIAFSVQVPTQTTIPTRFASSYYDAESRFFLDQFRQFCYVLDVRVARELLPLESVSLLQLGSAPLLAKPCLTLAIP